MHAAIGLPARHLQAVLQIVDRIYAAACGEAPWDRALAEMCRVGRLDACALSTIDRLERHRLVLASSGLRPATNANAILGPMPGDPPSTGRILRSRPGDVWQDRQIGSEALPGSLVWADWMQSNGFISRAWVIVGQDERQAVCLEAYAGAGRPPGGPDLGDLLRQLAPHLTRAWRLGSVSRSTLVPASPAPASPAMTGMVRLRAEFRLTKAEARLALRLAEGSSLASAAEDFNVKLTTIRSQLQQVFAKTGTSRQPELVALLLSRGYGTRGPLWNPPSRGRQAAALAKVGS
jgi:DNA-binding CsgD family transcriptional regulator